MNQRQVEKQHQGNSMQLQELKRLRAEKHALELRVQELLGTTPTLLTEVKTLKAQLADARTILQRVSAIGAKPLKFTEDVGAVIAQACLFLDRGCLPPGLLKAAPPEEKKS